MCRTVHAVLQTVICGIQMLVRVFMTVILMIENVIRMILQTAYNFISFLLQMVSLIPICIVFLLTARLKCFMCGGGGPCPVNRGGTCDCLMSGLAFVILFFIFRATGVLDKIFYSLGYTKARPMGPMKFVPTPGDITECSRNDSETETMTETVVTFIETTQTTTPNWNEIYETVNEDEYEYETDEDSTGKKDIQLKFRAPNRPNKFAEDDDSLKNPSKHGKPRRLRKKKRTKSPVTTPNTIWTTVQYYLI